MCLGKCYAALNENELAEKYYLENIRLDGIIVKNKLEPPDAVADETIADFYLNSGQYRKAGTYFKKVQKEIPLGERGNRVADFMFKVDSAAGKYLFVIKNLQRSQKVKDSAFSAAKIKQIEKLGVEYETEQRK